MGVWRFRMINICQLDVCLIGCIHARIIMSRNCCVLKKKKCFCVNLNKIYREKLIKYARFTGTIIISRLYKKYMRFI